MNKISTVKDLTLSPRIKNPQKPTLSEPVKAHNQTRQKPHAQNKTAQTKLQSL